MSRRHAAATWASNRADMRCNCSGSATGTCSDSHSRFRCSSSAETSTFCLREVPSTSSVVTVTLASRSSDTGTGVPCRKSLAETVRGAVACPVDHIDSGSIAIEALSSYTSVRCSKVFSAPILLWAQPSTALTRGCPRATSSAKGTSTKPACAPSCSYTLCSTHTLAPSAGVPSSQNTRKEWPAGVLSSTAARRPMRRRTREANPPPRSSTTNTPRSSLSWGKGMSTLELRSGPCSGRFTLKLCVALSPSNSMSSLTLCLISRQ
mmetsp:Transcript_13216/g.23547  ORF Transcript_13216/g.23547 Transcript_13216/m.23547 type:complete len:264 (-) Transcript_13216:1642-2433(-)